MTVSRRDLRLRQLVVVGQGRQSARRSAQRTTGSGSGWSGSPRSLGHRRGSCHRRRRTLAVHPCGSASSGSSPPRSDPRTQPGASMPASRGGDTERDGGEIIHMFERLLALTWQPATLRRFDFRLGRRALPGSGCSAAAYAAGRTCPAVGGTPGGTAGAAGVPPAAGVGECSGRSAWVHLYGSTMRAVTRKHPTGTATSASIGRRTRTTPSGVAAASARPSFRNAGPATAPGQPLQVRDVTDPNPLGSLQAAPARPLPDPPESSPQLQKAARTAGRSSSTVGADEYPPPSRAAYEGGNLLPGWSTDQREAPRR